MNIIDEVLAREARKMALKKARREKWRTRLSGWWRRPSFLPPTPATSDTTTTPKKVARRDRMWFVAGAVLLVAASMMVYGLSSLSKTWTALLPMWAWVVIAILVSILLSGLIYYYKTSSSRKKSAVQTLATATTAATAQPTTTTIVVTRRTVPNWAAAIFWLILGAVVLLAIGWGGYYGYRWLTSDASKGTKLVAISPTHIEEIEATKEGWSRWVEVPPGQRIKCDRTELVAFEAQIQDMDIFRFPRNFGEQRTKVHGTLEKIRFRVVDEEKSSVRILIKFFPY